MIDLHCHLLDGIGCGPESFEESLEMCRQSLENGVRTIVATPSWEAGSDEPPLPLAECHEKIDALRKKMAKSRLSIRLGFLMKFRSDLDALLKQYGTSITLGGGHYVLVALPALHIPEDAEEVWKRLSRQDISVLLARPACSPVLRRDPQLLKKWVEMGLLLQLDAASLIGSHGREVQRFALHCVEEFSNSVVLASSARRATPDASMLGQACAQVTKRNGAQLADSLVNKTPDAIINGDRGFFKTRRPPVRPRSVSLLRSLRPQKSLTNTS